MSSPMEPEQRDANAEIIERLARIEAGVQATNGRVTALEKWQAEHQPWSEQGRDLIQAQADAVSAFEAKIDRLTIDTLAKVTASMQAMFQDAVKEATTIAIEGYTDTEEGKRWFRETLQEDREQARKERVQDMRRYLTLTRAAVLWVVPIVTIISTLGQIFSWW